MIINQITRYPIKGFYGQNVPEANVSKSGMAGDRRFGIYHPSRVKNRSPAGWSPKINFLQMVFEAFLGAYQTEFDVTGEILTLSIDGKTYGPYNLTQPEGKIALAKQIRAFGDLEDNGPLEIIEGTQQSLTDRSEPCISLANPASLGDLETKIGRNLGRTRFRMNAWFDGLDAWEEHDLVGRILRIGTLEVRVLERVDRCRAINLTPGDREWNHDDINTHMKRIYGHNDLGLLCACVTPGAFAVGDTIQIL